MHVVEFFVAGDVCESHDCKGAGSPGDEDRQRLGGVHEQGVWRKATTYSDFYQERIGAKQCNEAMTEKGNASRARSSLRHSIILVSTRHGQPPGLRGQTHLPGPPGWSRHRRMYLYIPPLPTSPLACTGKNGRL